MSIIYFDGHSENGLHDALYTKCKCGHYAYQHGNTWNGMGQQQYLRVLQCVMCDCKEFEMESGDDKKGYINGRIE